jgi:hypothetical protein
MENSGLRNLPGYRVYLPEGVSPKGSRVECESQPEAFARYPVTFSLASPIHVENRMELQAAKDVTRMQAAWRSVGRQVKQARPGALTTISVTWNDCSVRASLRLFANLAADSGVR